MNAEILTIGNELLVGMIIDTNSVFIAKELKELGIDCEYKTTVGDNKDHIVKAIDTAVKRANIVIITGGLGPTEDDITIESLAECFKTQLELKKEVAEHIEKLFRYRDREMPDSNLKQAYIPIGSKVLNNAVGTAPGVMWDVTKIIDSKEKKIILVFPGVPRELEYLWKNRALPILKEFSSCCIYEKYLNFAGIGESALVELLDEFMKSSDPVVLPYANNFQVQLRVFSKHSNIEIAKNNVENMVLKIKNKTYEYLYGVNDETLEESVGKLLLKDKKTISIAESCTGGLISSRLTDVSGSSEYIKLNLVTYSNESKMNELNVPEELIIKYGAVSEQVAVAMANGIRLKTGTDIGVGVTGIAGPTGGSPDKPVGTVFISISDKNDTVSYKFNSNPELHRVYIKQYFSQILLFLLRKRLIGFVCLHN